MSIEKNIFHRTELLLGKSFIKKATEKKVIIFGIGGVGSWCAESLIRSGIGHLTIVDSDKVCITNVNRQLMATTKTVGEVKTEVLKNRLLEINPTAEITALRKIYSPETSDSFELYNFDFIIDAIDSFSNKIHLIQTATQTNAVFFSSMGAALKMNPLHIKVAEFWKVQGCPFGASLRKRLKKLGGTNKKFLCVYSDELLKNKGENVLLKTDKNTDLEESSIQDEQDVENKEWSSLKTHINGSTSYMPAMFGMTIASLVVQAIDKE